MGYANIEHEVPVNENSVFKIGSLSKSILATGMMLLVEDGLVKLSDDVCRYIPKLRAQSQGITIEMLLSHTAGLRRNPVNENFFAVGSLQAIVDTLENWTLVDRPGESFSYSNLGYFVLGFLIEELSGLRFSTFFEERIFKKLGMVRTRTTSAYEIIKNRSASYFVANNSVLNAGDLIQFRPSGAFISTITDMLIWDKSLRNFSILSEDGFDRMATPVRLRSGKASSYGFGWYVFRGRHDTILFHGGGLWSFRSYHLFLMKAGISIVVLANRRDTNVKAITTRILDMTAPEIAADWAEATVAVQSDTNNP